MHKLGRLVCKSEKRKLTRAVNGDLQGCARDACRRRWWWSEGECAVGTSKATLLTAPQTPILEVKLGWRLPRPAQEVPERSLSSLRQSSECPSYLGDRSPGPKRSHDCPLCEAARRLKGALISSCATYTPLHPSCSSPLVLSFTVALVAQFYRRNRHSEMNLMHQMSPEPKVQRDNTPGNPLAQTSIQMRSVLGARVK